MPSLEVIVTASLDGHPLPGSPFTQILAVLSYQTISVKKSVDAEGVFTTIPTVDALTPLCLVLLTCPDAQLVYRVNGQTDSGITIPAGGLLLVSNSDIGSGATTNLEVSNSSSGAVATIQGVIAQPNP